MVIRLHGKDCVVRFRHRHYTPPMHITSRRYATAKDRWVRGYTKVEMFVDGRKIANDGAWCSREDEFDPGIGRKQAFRHMLENWGFTRPERMVMWAGFWKAEDHRRRRDGETEVREADKESGESGAKDEILLPEVGAGVSLEQAGENLEA